MRRDEKICICCGEPMTQPDNERGENPNVCSPCESFGSENETAEGSDAKGFCGTEERMKGTGE